MLEEVKEEVKEEMKPVVNVELNKPLTGGIVHVVPGENLLAVKSPDGRIILYKNGAIDVTNIAVPVSRAEMRLVREKVEPLKLVMYKGRLAQVIKDTGASVKAFIFETGSISEFVPEMDPLMHVRNFYEVYVPEANAFGGDIFGTMKYLAAAAGDRDALYALRQKEWLAANIKGVTPADDGLDEVLAYSGNAALLQMKTVAMQNQQLLAMASMAKAVSRIADALGSKEDKPACPGCGNQSPAPTPDVPDAPEQEEMTK